MDKYYLSLGRFIDCYAQTERRIFLLAITLANMGLDGAQSLLSGMRAGAFIKNMRRLYQARGEEVPPLLDRALSQLQAITTTRDHIIHTGVLIDGDDLVSTNWLRAHAERSRKSITVSEEMLDLMSADLDTISAVFDVFGILHRDPTAFDSEPKGALYRAAQTPLRYRPS